MNAKELLDQLRDNINEASTDHWSDLGLLRRLNLAQRRAAKMFAMSPGQWLVKRATVTPVASVITLPSDCSKPIYLEEVSNGVPIKWLPSVSYRAPSHQNASSLTLSSLDQAEAYPLRDTIEVNTENYTAQCYLYYQQRVPNLHTGTAGSGSGANALEFASDLALSFVDDYYNGVTVEVIDQSSGIVDIRSEISDFVASTRIATITGTPASGDIYATVSVLPEEAEDYILAQATIMSLMKPGSIVDKDVLQFFRDDANRARVELEDWLATRIVEKSDMNYGDVY